MRGWRHGRAAGPAYLTTSLRKRTVKKWLAMLPALNSSRPSGPRRCAVAREISLYSTTRYTPSTRHTTPTGSVGLVFSTTCRQGRGQGGGLSARGFEATVVVLLRRLPGISQEASFTFDSRLAVLTPSEPPLPAGNAEKRPFLVIT